MHLSWPSMHTLLCIIVAKLDLLQLVSEVSDITVPAWPMHHDMMHATKLQGSALPACTNKHTHTSRAACSR